MPSSVSNPLSLTRHISSPAAPAMTTVPVCPPTGSLNVIPPMPTPPMATAPVAPAPCPSKMVEAPSDAGTGKPAKRSRSSKAATETPAVVPAVAVVESSEDMKPPDSGSWLIVAKAVRMHLKSHETAMHCGSDALPALNAKLADMIRDAIVRAQGNGRKTLKACDF